MGIRSARALRLERVVIRRAGLVAVVLAALTAPASAATWSETFADEADTVLFFAADGALWKAPFHLGAREPLWTPRGAEHLVRVAVSPAGGRAAWLTRAGDQDSTWLWTGDRSAARPRLRFMSLQPRQVGRLHFDPIAPSLEDRRWGYRGGRFVSSHPQLFRYSTSALEWTSGGGGVVFGYREGLGLVAPDSGRAIEISRAFVVELRSLGLAPMMLADIVTTVDGRRLDGWHLLYPSGGFWKLYPGFDPARPWTAGPDAVWWAIGGTIRSARAHDPTHTIERKESGDVVWLEHDEKSGSLAWAAGRALMRRQAEGEPARVHGFGAPIQAVFGASGASWRAIFTGDSIALWNPADDRCVRARLQAEPIELIETRDGGPYVVVRVADSPRLRRFDVERGTMSEVATPSVKAGALAKTPSGSRVLLYKPGRNPPDKIHVFDPKTETWTQVSNPGITGWELLTR